MKNFTFGVGKTFSGDPKGGRVARFQEIEKSLHITVAPSHSENFSILAELESVYKSGSFGEVLGPSRVGGKPAFKIAIYRTVVQTHTENFSTLTLFGCKRTKKTSYVREK